MVSCVWGVIVVSEGRLLWFLEGGDTSEEFWEEGVLWGENKHAERGGDGGRHDNKIRTIQVGQWCYNTLSLVECYCCRALMVVILVF